MLIVFGTGVNSFGVPLTRPILYFAAEPRYFSVSVIFCRRHFDFRKYCIFYLKKIFEKKNATINRPNIGDAGGSQVIFLATSALPMIHMYTD